MQEVAFKPLNKNAIHIKPEEVGWEERFMIINPKKLKDSSKKTNMAESVINQSI
jgi:hypothetical protein